MAKGVKRLSLPFKALRLGAQSFEGDLKKSPKIMVGGLETHGGRRMETNKYMVFADLSLKRETGRALLETVTKKVFDKRVRQTDVCPLCGGSIVKIKGFKMTHGSDKKSRLRVMRHQCAVCNFVVASIG